MKRLSLSIALNAAGDGGAPEHVKLIPAGQVEGRDGRAWLFDGQAAQDVIAQFQGRAVDLPIDWEHATQHRAPNGEEAPAGGWIQSLEIRDGALWGAVSWTPRAAAQVANREYRYLSPVFDYDPATGRIVRLVSAGLVNTPNLHLQALNSEGDAPMSRSTLLAAAIAALGLDAKADDDALATAINSLKSDRDTAQALNSEDRTANLERFVPRPDYDAALARATNAEQKLQQREAADLKEKVDAAIEGALTAGKITPATVDYHRATCSDSKGLERFRAFVAAAPSIAADTTGLDKKPSGTATALNSEQQEACRLLGIPEADFAAELAGKE